MGQVTSNIVSEFLTSTLVFASRTKRRISELNEFSSSKESSDTESTSASESSLLDSDSGVLDVPSSIQSSGVSDSSSYLNFIAYHPPSQSYDDYSPIPARSLPDPEPGHRPYWGPPILDYSNYSDLLQAHHAITIKEGSVDIVSRTLVLDNTVKAQLIDDYLEYVNIGIDEAEGKGLYMEMDFYEELAGELRIDEEDLKVEREQIVEVVGTENVETLVRKLAVEVDVVRRERGLTAFADMWECDGSD